MPFGYQPYASWYYGHPYPSTGHPYVGYRAIAENYYPGSGLAAWTRWTPVFLP
jgi:hypothetical protein